MYTPKRTLKKHEESLVSGGASSPFRSSFFQQEHHRDFTTNKTPTRSGIQVIEQDSTHQLTTLGSSLPVEIAEILSQNTDNTAARIHAGGWASVISHRKLYLWKYTTTSLRKTVNCIELLLPPTELKHTPSLTAVLENATNDPMQAISAKTSFIAVSAEGAIRYWPNINRPSITVETHMSLNGKQCHNLLQVMPHGCILTTTTNEMFLISPTATSILFSPLSLPSGMLSSISRRVSSFWAQPALPSNTPPPCLCLSTVDPDVAERTFLTVFNGSLQKWVVSGPSESQAKMITQIDLLKMIQCYQYNSMTPFSDHTTLHVLGMRCVGFGTLIFANLLNDESTISVLISLKSHEVVFKISQITHVKENLQSDEVELVLPAADYHAYISTKSMILAQSVSHSSWLPVKVEFNATTNAILAAGVNGNDAVFLTKRHGMVTLKLTETPSSVLLESTKKEQKIVPEDVKMESDSVDTSNAYVALKSLFVLYSTSKQIDPAIFASLDFSTDDLRESILNLSKELLDSLPATDASWAAQKNIGLTTSSVLLLNQLQDKHEIHETFINFLNTLQIWPKYHDFFSLFVAFQRRNVPFKDIEVKFQVGGHSAVVQFMLYENSERLQCMVALLNLYERFKSLIDDVLEDMSIDTIEDERSMSKKDVFFSKEKGTSQDVDVKNQISSIEDFFSKLIESEKNKLEHVSTLKEQVDLISTVGELFATCFTTAWQYRQSIGKDKQSICSLFVPWTGSAKVYSSLSVRPFHILLPIWVPGFAHHSLFSAVIFSSDNIGDGARVEQRSGKGNSSRSHLSYQIHLILDQALPNVDSTKVGSTLTRQIILLADLLLDGYERQISISEDASSQRLNLLTEQYQQERQYIVLSLVELGYLEEATTLAEKYEDFLSLIVLCEKQNDNEKLEQYKTTYQNQGFSDVLYRWYMEKGAWGTLMAQADSNRTLDKFLDGYEGLNWLHYLGSNEFTKEKGTSQDVDVKNKASHLLKQLSENEAQLAERKKMMLVMSNLAMMASDENNETIQTHVNSVDDELEMFEYQEKILTLLGKQATEIQPLKASETLQLVLQDDMICLSDEDFMTVLHLLRQEDLTQDLARSIWKKCIQQDRWEDCPQLDYVAVVSQKTFFKCLKRCQDNEVYRELIPSLDEMLSLDDGTSSSDDVLGRQLKACYEVLNL